MTTEVLFIGLDSAEPDIIEAFAADGTMPNVARLMERATTVPLETGVELPGATWPELATGRYGSRSGVYFPPSQIINGQGALRRMEADYLETDEWFWVVADRAGKRAASIDMVHAAVTDCDAFEIVEWGSHDRMISPTQSSPPSALPELESRHGSYPVHSCDTLHRSTLTGYRNLTRGLLEGARRKGVLTSEILEREPWDLFSIVFTETHCACHQLWHFHDPTHHRHPRFAPFGLLDSYREVHRAVDAGVGAVIDAAGPDAQIVLSAIKGAAPAIGGTQLTNDVLAAIGMSTARSWKGSIWDALPPRAKGQFKRIPTEFRNKSGVADEPGLDGFVGTARSLRNDHVGAVRIGIEGRDPGGSVRPDDADHVLATIEATFRSLRHVPTGQPAVTDVVRLFDRFGEAAHPDLPDLAILFNTDVGVIGHVWSPETGHLRRPYRRIRTGDHTGAARAWIASPQVTDHVDEPRPICDITASLLAMAGVDTPSSYDGTSVGLIDV